DRQRIRKFLIPTLSPQVSEIHETSHHLIDLGPLTKGPWLFVALDENQSPRNRKSLSSLQDSPLRIDATWCHRWRSIRSILDLLHVVRGALRLVLAPISQRANCKT